MGTSSAIAAVIFDWAGTTVDFGSMAPVMAFEAAFKEAGVPLSMEEMRKPMGLEKSQHLAVLLADESIQDRWRKVHGSAPTHQDRDRLLGSFNAHLISILPSRAQPIPGVLDAIANLRSAGVKIGSNSGYSRSMMEVLARAAQTYGFAPDCVVSATDVAAGRPAPDLSRKCLELLGLDGKRPAIKVDDTEAGIAEGRNAGLWTVAVAVSGNEVGLTEEEWTALDQSEQSRLRAAAYESLRSAGADYVIDSVADLPPVVKDIESRLTRR